MEKWDTSKTTAGLKIENGSNASIARDMDTYRKIVGRKQGKLSRREKGEEVVALVDTGSAITLISKACYDRLAKIIGPLKMKETNVNIMGIAGLSRKCEGRIEKLPIKFGKKEWELNADIIYHPTVDIVLGQNFLTKVLKATLNLPKLQMNLSNGELIQLYRESSRTISLCLMAKTKK